MNLEPYGFIGLYHSRCLYRKKRHFLTVLFMLDYLVFEESLYSSAKFRTRALLFLLAPSLIVLYSILVSKKVFKEIYHK